jgi:hypothetical protein
MNPPDKSAGYTLYQFDDAKRWYDGLDNRQAAQVWQRIATAAIRLGHRDKTEAEDPWFYALMQGLCVFEWRFATFPDYRAMWLASRHRA